MARIPRVVIPLLWKFSDKELVYNLRACGRVQRLVCHYIYQTGARTNDVTIV